MSITSYPMDFIALGADDINFCHGLHPKMQSLRYQQVCVTTLSFSSIGTRVGLIFLFSALVPLNFFGARILRLSDSAGVLM